MQNVTVDELLTLQLLLVTAKALTTCPGLIQLRGGL